MFAHVVLFLTVTTISGCSTGNHREQLVLNEAKLEAPVKDSSETHAKILEILNLDSSIGENDRVAIIDVINKKYSDYNELELVTNQKKTLLIRELMKKDPDKAKVRDIRSAILKNYNKKTKLMMDSFDSVSKIVCLHPETANRLLNRADLLWNLRDR